MMNVKCIVLCTLLFSISCVNQHLSVQTVENKRLKIIDSIKVEIFRDTNKFRIEDLKTRSEGHFNVSGYSKLYVVNGRYNYILDIIPGNEVKKFVTEILNSSKIDDIKISPLDSNMAITVYGYYAKNGVVLITMKKGSNYNLEITGLKKRKGKNNFSANYILNQ